MRNPEQILENLNKQSVKHYKDDKYKFNELYKHFLNPLFYKYAYAQLYSNFGFSTIGINGETMDGFSDEFIQKIINCMKDESYQPKPVRRIFIPKKNGNMRPTQIPSIIDRYIQEIINEILTIIYEPIFKKNSYGFRQGLGCHNALHAIQTTFQGTVWFIEGDIKSFFDNIDHHVMIEILKKKINDERFIRLIWKFLRAGYLENWTFNKTYSGTPQGGIISPILSNIYLNEFDNYIKQLQENFNKGDSNKVGVTSNYNNKRYKLRKIGKEINAKQVYNTQCIKNKEYKELIKNYKKLKFEQINSTRQDYNSKNRYKKLCYVRYADDFILGVIGSREEAENIKQDIGNFLNQQLKLELSNEKTLITHSSNKAKFLSYEISIYQRGIIHKVRNPKTGIVELKSDGRGQVKLTMSKDIIIKNLVEMDIIEDLNAKTWKAKRNSKLIGNSDLEIIEIYNEQIRGLYNYFRLANNVSIEMNKFYYIMKWSMFHTFATKYKSTVPKMLSKYRIDNTEEFGVPYENKQGKQIRKFYHEGFKRKQYVENKSSSVSNEDYIPNMYKFMGRNELEKRILANKCEWCGKETKCHVHHINAMKNIRNKKNPLHVFMSARNRKTINLCPECHLRQRQGLI